MRARSLPALFTAPLLAAALAGCAAPPPPPAQPVSLRLPPAPAPAPAAEPAAPERPADAPDPPELPLPDPAACTLTAERWRGAATTTDLRLRRGGPVFATISSPAARLHLPAGPAEAGAVLEAEDAGLALRGHIDGSAVVLRPAQPVLLGGFAVPQPDAALAWEQAAPGLVSVRFQPGAGVEVLEGPLRAEVRCDAVALERSRFDARAAVSGARLDRRALLRMGRAIPLAAAPGAAPAARLLPADDLDAEVRVIEVNGARSRVIWERNDVLVFGWVASADLRPVPKNLTGQGYGTGSGSGFGRSVHSIARVVCPADVPVIVEIEGERATVGRVRAGTVIDVMKRGGDHAPIVVQSGRISIPSGASLLAREDHLAACSPAPR